LNKKIEKDVKGSTCSRLNSTLYEEANIKADRHYRKVSFKLLKIV